MPGGKIVSEISDEEKHECLMQLRRLLSDDEKLDKLKSDDAYLKRFLYSTDFIVEKAYKKMKMFYDLLEEYPEWFALGPPLDKKDIIEKDIRLLTSVCDKEGRPVYIIKVANMNANAMSLATVIGVDDFFIELLLANDPQSKNGLSVIIDVSNFPWNIMRWLTPQNIKIALRRIHTMPIKRYIFHVVNKSMLVHAAINVIWPFLPQFIKDDVKFHFDDWNALYEYIDQDVLPPEYGGPNIMDYNKSRDQVFDKNEEIFSSFKINRKMYLQSIEDMCKQ